MDGTDLGWRRLFHWVSQSEIGLGDISQSFVDMRARKMNKTG